MKRKESTAEIRDAKAAEKAPAKAPAKRPVKQPKYTKAEGCLGIQANVYRRLKISRRAFFEYRRKWPEIQQAIDDEQEQGLDVAEDKLMQKIQAGNRKAISFDLEKKGADRGWSGGKQQIELTAPPEPPIICFTRHNHAENDDTDASPAT